MPVTPAYPGVYIEEVPSGVRTITGVATSIAAFIGYTARGPVNAGTAIFNFGDFETVFGGLDQRSPLSYAVEHFFRNGGGQAVIVRVASGAAAASIGLSSAASGGTHVLTVTARSEGTWGNGLRLAVDYDTAIPASLFNLTVTEFVDRGGTLQPARTETHRNLSMNSFAPNYAVATVNAASELVRLERTGTAASLAGLVDGNGTSTSGVLTEPELVALNDDRRRLRIALDGGLPREFDIFDAGGSITGANLNAKLDNLATRITSRVVALDPSPAFAGFTAVRSGATIVATSGTANGSGERSSVRFSPASVRSATVALKLGTLANGREADAAALIRPAATGTVSGSLAAVNIGALAQPAAIAVTIDEPGAASDGPFTLPLWDAAGRPSTLAGVVSAVQAALAASPKAALRDARVLLVDGQMVIVSGGANPSARLTFSNAAADTTATTLALATGAANVAGYALGLGATVAAQLNPVPGDDGLPPSAAGLAGSRAAKSGLYALEDVDLFNILTLPEQSDAALLSTALAYVRERRAFLLVDLPAETNTLTEAQAWLSANGSLRDQNAAVYFPRILAADPLDNNRFRTFPNSGAIAGLYARTDGERGVWKAPAGTDAVLRGVRALDYVLTDPENGVLNPLGMNCLRNFPGFGPVVWGARTLRGSDQLASEWKYVPVRRLALFLEESLYRGTQWVVFEPNDEPLWAQIRLNVGAFMNNLFRQGAFQGRTPRDAYLVKCDAETTRQNDINLGIVNVVVGFAPLKPAEFVIIKIQQLAGQIQA
ncbi:hypothetical protein Sa4125_22750 [Aureimonas sp. SA4125]|uniref:phage tail sheath family protein n=1 Tax=Aureimonas sp. SA4125 TaxID=2826993 RepID=UPI001CC6F627|nr:phage tail sheath subtilisin-like domain-containing protein [Aureimonas sp. SA4125]BDA84733.1 hypothetical protein Sa4125_22750 [Aureimonas sp. SA4125]